MKKIIITTIFTMLFITSFILIKRMQKSTGSIAYCIGILQTASHPALDAARDGFMTQLKTKMSNNVEFIIYNAQGSITTAHSIAQRFHTNNKFSGFFSIATPAAQAIGTIEKERPIFIAAVTDPQALGLLNATTNICGVKDMINVRAEIDMLRQLIPKAKTVGLLYTAGEVNSLSLVKIMRAELEVSGLAVIDFAVSGELDLPTITTLACRKVDVILAPTDNVIASSITLISSITLAKKKPFIVSDNMLVQLGALAARGVNYDQSGKQAADIAYAVLVEGKKPYDLPIEQAQSNAIYINKTILNALELQIPDTLLPNVILVETKD